MLKKFKADKSLQLPSTKTNRRQRQQTQSANLKSPGFQPEIAINTADSLPSILKWQRDRKVEASEFNIETITWMTVAEGRERRKNSREINHKLLEFLDGPFCREIFALKLKSESSSAGRKKKIEFPNAICFLFSVLKLIIQGPWSGLFLKCVWDGNAFCLLLSRTQKVFTELNQVMGFLFTFPPLEPLFTCRKRAESLFTVQHRRGSIQSCW